MKRILFHQRFFPEEEKLKVQILVIGGQELGVNIMQGIAKMYGFDKKDFEFVDYDKAKDFTGKICKDGKCRAVIFGTCSHKTVDLAGYSSTVEKMKNELGSFMLPMQEENPVNRSLQRNHSKVLQK